MAMEGKMSVIKYLMFFFNFLFWLSGLALIVIGAIIRDKYGEYLTFADNKYAEAAVFLIVVGVVVFIIGFLGCCGAIRENYCMVTTFAVLLTIIFILEIAAGALGFAYRKKVKGIVEEALKRGVKNYHKEKGAKKFYDWLQPELKCCGYNGRSDWAKQSGNVTLSRSRRATAVNSSTAAPTAPPTQASSSAAPSGNGTTAAPTPAPTSGNSTAGGVPDSCHNYTEGCKDKFENFVQKKLVLIGGVGIGLAFLQVLGIIFACCLMREIRGQYEVV